MKFAGYSCYVFSAILTILIVFGLTKEIDAAKSLVGTWLLAGSSLLTVNAGKRLAGHVAMNKQGAEK